jgi:integrase
MEASQILTKVAECLYRNGHGTYFAIVKVNGKQIKRSLKTDDSALAKRRLGELRIKAKGLSGQDKSMLFDHLVTRWLSVKKPDLRPNSYERLKGIAGKAGKFFDGLPVRSIGQTQIERWKITRAGEIGARSFNYERDTLRQIFEYARLNLRIILDNPADTVKKRKTDKPHIVIPTKEQFRTLLAALRNEPRAKEAARLVEFLAYSGLRLGEAREVCWRDINFDLNTLVVTGGEIGTKNHEFRIVPLFAPLLRFLIDLKKEQNAGENSKVLHLASAKKALITACRKSGLPQFGHHSMRHFFCSNAIEAGCDFKVIAEWLGHKDGGVLVAKTYGHLRNEHSAAMAKRITFDVDTKEPENVVNFANQ